jgi:endonuclease IV
MTNLSIVEINLQLQAVTPHTLESISACTEYGSKLAAWIAYTGLAKAQAKRDLLQKKKETIENLLKENHRLTPANFKEYVAASVSNEEYNFELADRTNAAATHQLDLIRSILSALKTEMASVNFYKS